MLLQSSRELAEVAFAQGDVGALFDPLLLAPVCQRAGQHASGTGGKHPDQLVGKTEFPARPRTTLFCFQPECNRFASKGLAHCRLGVRRDDHRHCRRAWARLIGKVWSADPLVCPKCSGPMRIISFIEDPSVIERTCHLKLWEPPERPPSLGDASPHPCSIWSPSFGKTLGLTCGMG